MEAGGATDRGDDEITCDLLRFGPPLIITSSASSEADLLRQCSLTGRRSSKIVGVECESSIADIRRKNASSDKDAVGSESTAADGLAECLLLTASTDDEQAVTVIEALRTDLSKAITGRRTLVVLKGCRDIMHVSLSCFGPSGEELLCITEKVKEAAAAGPSSDPEDPGEAAEEDPCHFKIYAVLQGDASVMLDLTPAESFQHNGFPGYHAGYFIKSESRRAPNALILASDNCCRGIAVCEIVYVSKSNTLRMTAHEKWNLAVFQLWHNWNPFKQQISFIADCDKFIKTRIVSVDGSADRRVPVFERNCRKRAHYRQGRPLGISFGAGNSSPNSCTFVQMLNIVYECGTEDVALCSQLLRKYDNSDSFRIICVITLLRNHLLECTVNIDQFVPAGRNYRVCFLYLNGMVVIFLPGVCIHFVDVSHKEQPPRYLFGASCQFTDEQALMAHNLSQSPSGFLATLPVPSGQWVYAPGTSWISHVRVSRSRCWNLIEQALARRHLGVHFQVALHGMLHCATTHFKTAVLSDSNQRLITIVQSMSIRFAPDILVEFVQGETYARWRNSVRSVSPFWRFAPLYDEDGYGALADEFRDLNLARFSLGDDSAGGGSATVLLPFSHGSSVSPSAASVKEECFMTPEKWWTKNLIPLSSGSFLKRLLSDQLVPVQRISLQKSKRGDDQTYAKFVQMLFQRRQIPTEQAEQLAPIYVDHLAAVVDDLVTCASRDPRSIHPHAQLSFLHVLNDALLSMQFPFRGPLPERLSRLTYSHFPMPALSECCNSSVFAAQLDAVVQSFDRLFPVSELSRPIAVEHKAISGDLSRSRLSTLPSAAAVASPAVPQSYVFKEREEDRRVGATRSVTRRNAPCTSILPFRDYLQFSFCSLVDKSRNHPEGKFTHADVEKVLAEYCGVAMVQFHRHMLGVDAMPHYMPLEQFVSQVRFRQGVGETSALAGSAKSSGAGAAEHLVLVTMKNSKVKEAQTMLRNKAITRELELVKTTRSRLAFERLLYPFAVSTLNERTLKD